MKPRREQARRIGEAFRARGIAFRQVLSSQWCRTRETADLPDLGPVSDASSLNSVFQDFATRERQTRETGELIGSAEGRLMLVTHQVNIPALTGRGTRPSEALTAEMMA
ncbi:hypothetical protein [Hoeflea alexandrii]|uniref:hypothetical protein n=1 Tax=Hoeflea alexandrii TaxID=288436 RepID=UPI0022AEB668|nr:hypothetical protein [Hoeflea alexandrii]MCZ4288182.1 hypothetical protein [Hoeflea alexandrii]